MALDDSILEAVSSGESPPTLRLYAWQPPCLSIGYAQPVADVDRQRLQERNWDIVRRPTGGRAILHTDELTYAVVGPQDNPHLAGGVLQSYRHLSQGFVHALNLLGLEVEVQPDLPVPDELRINPVCFQVPSAYEITVQGKKLIGSAQVRRQGGILQHGSIPLRGDITLICQVLHYNDKDRSQAAKLVQARATTVEALLGSSVSWHQVAEAVVQGFKEALGLDLEMGTLTEAEQARSMALATARYADDGWTARA
jgi:lipoate-protein ligase A